MYVKITFIIQQSDSIWPTDASTRSQTSMGPVLQEAWLISVIQAPHLGKGTFGDPFEVAEVGEPPICW